MLKKGNSMSKVIESLTNNNYRVLKFLSDNQVELNGIKFIAITQIEIAQELGLSKVTVNSIMRDLQEKKLVCPFENRRGKYCLSDKAEIIIKSIEQINKKLEEG